MEAQTPLGFFISSVIFIFSHYRLRLPWLVLRIWSQAKARDPHIFLQLSLGKKIRWCISESAVYDVVVFAACFTLFILPIIPSL